MRRFAPATALLAATIAGAAMLAGACGGTPAPTPTPGATMDGRGLYASNCARCHGGDLKGTTLGPPLLDAIYRPGHHSDAAFRVAVKNGVRPHHWNFGPMPPIPGLTDDQVGEIIAFIREEQREVGIR
ncbi:MAG: cytochrome c [Chloroflexi bacterium]|nr:cytochrome c [Chloroflexota bacterium]